METIKADLKISAADKVEKTLKSSSSLTSLTEQSSEFRKRMGEKVGPTISSTAIEEKDSLFFHVFKLRQDSKYGWIIILLCQLYISYMFLGGGERS